MILRLVWLLVVFSARGVTAEVETIGLPAEGEISSAEVYVWRGATQGEGARSLRGRGVLVLCPGQNGSSEVLVRNKVWQDFAEREGLALVGFRFVSSDEDLTNGRGYFVASRGSGELLEAGLKKTGLGGLPVMLYGFSGGAHFAMSYAAWRPDRVAGFCAYSFAWWSAPPEKLRCPALIVCGQADGMRYGASLAYFQEARRQGKPWTWVSLEGVGHEPNRALDGFVREFFRHELHEFSRIGAGDRRMNLGAVFFDNVTEREVPASRENDVGVSVLPAAGLAAKWWELHHP